MLLFILDMLNRVKILPVAVYFGRNDSTVIVTVSGFDVSRRSEDMISPRVHLLCKIRLCFSLYHNVISEMQYMPQIGVPNTIFMTHDYWI